jgi:ATP-dependent DNA helicase RecG
MSREVALANIHFPQDQNTLLKAQARLKFEELFYIQIKLLKQKVYRVQKIKGVNFGTIGKHFNDFFHNNLPFELTGAQKKVLREIRQDAATGKQMNRLLQGDVGSGKTLVALMTMLMALDNGYQSCLMAPTEILAQQHFKTLTRFLEGMDIKVEILTGSTKVAKRRVIHEGLQDGSISIIVGTHALVEDTVQFKNLGLAVIDEQHRFGVAQRARMWQKNEITPHILVMTATPIPRTLAMTLYGDLDISVIDELPPGRVPIKTLHYWDSSRLRVFGFMKEQIQKGRQIYIVYPLINESETLDLKHLMDGYESISRSFPLPEYAISIVHGQMKSAEKDYEMQRFIKGETNIMVATTVIEVGVDIPNASVMIIENAERFGLSQLHQLRGRVGRGAEQSYCILMTGNKVSSDGKKRIETMVQTNNGFEIAEADLHLRGPGDLQGLQQSGILDLKIADIVQDEKILKYARGLAMEIINIDPALEKPENAVILNQLNTTYREKGNWGMIG